MSLRGLRGGPVRSVVPAVLLAAGLFLGVPAALADPPTFTPNPPPDVIAEATSSAGATVSFTPVVTDDNPSPTVGCSPASGSTFPLGTTNVSCTATDTGDGTTSTASFNVIVHDTTPPTITLGGSQLTVE